MSTLASSPSKAVPRGNPPRKPEELLPLSKVTRILNKAGYKQSNNGMWSLPGAPTRKEERKIGVDCFNHAEELRKYLCAHHVVGHEKLTDLQKVALQRWVRYAIIPSLRGKTSVPVEAYDSPIKSLHVPLMDLGYTYKGGLYYEPGEQPKSVGGLAVNGRDMDGAQGMWAHLARHGFPSEKCDFSKTTEAKRLQVELFIADCPHVNTL